MTMMSREFQIFVKPVGPDCNLSCRYCYYLGKKRLYPDKVNYIMADDILENYIIGHIEATTGNFVNFSWHGGEPLLAGIDFFKKVLKFQQKYKAAGTTIVNGIQTNGTLLNDKWCSFLAAEGFTAGISIDGPASLHNINRRTRENNNSFLNVVRGYELLQRYGLLPEILCVVNSDNVKYPLVVYNFFKQLGAEYITFIPLVEPEPGSPGGVSRSTVPAGEFGFFLSAIFDEWVEKDIGKIKIQIFEEAARTAFNQDHTLCIFKVNCGGVPVVEHNGDFYSCDHYVDSDHFMGNIRDKPLSDFLDSDRQKAFGEAKSQTLPDYCVRCEVRPMCNGECPKNRFITTPEGEAGLNYLCNGYRYFFNHCRPFVEAISSVWNNQNNKQRSG
jgi:uncharacterized protein